MQTGIDLYDNSVLSGLDYAIYAAREFDIKVILCLYDNWSLDRVIDWADEAAGVQPLSVDLPKDPATGDIALTLLSDEQKRAVTRRHAQFFEREDLWELYAAHVRKILTRRNTFTGKIYAEDPSILG